MSHNLPKLVMFMAFYDTYHMMMYIIRLATGCKFRIYKGNLIKCSVFTKVNPIHCMCEFHIKWIQYYWSMHRSYKMHDFNKCHSSISSTTGLVWFPKKFLIRRIEFNVKIIVSGKHCFWFRYLDQATRLLTIYIQ